MSSKSLHHILHNPIWARELAGHLASSGYDPETIIAKAGFEEGIPDDVDIKVPFENISTFFELAAGLCEDDLLGFHFGQQTDIRDAGLIAFVGINSAILRDCVINMSAYVRVMGDAVDIDLRNFKTNGQLRWQFNLPPSKARRQYVEWFATTFVATFRHITNTPIWCEKLSFIHPRNAHVDDIERFFGCDVAFGAESNTLTSKTADLDKPIVNADHRLLELLKGIAGKALEDTKSNRPKLQERVERAILTKLSSGEVSATSTARDLGMSARTLGRRLEEIELPFSALLNNLREALAGRYLRESDLTITQIAFLLGYSDTSAFSTAHKQWTGTTPTEVRRAK